MSVTKIGHPHLKGHRDCDETKAIWDLAREGRSPELIAGNFGLDRESVDKIRAWQQKHGFTQIVCACSGKACKGCRPC